MEELSKIETQVLRNIDISSKDYYLNGISFCENSQPVANFILYLCNFNTIDGSLTFEAINNISSYTEKNTDTAQWEQPHFFTPSKILVKNYNTTKCPTWLHDYFYNFLDLSIKPKSYDEVPQDKEWRNLMIYEIKYIHNNKTWSIIILP